MRVYVSAVWWYITSSTFVLTVSQIKYFMDQEKVCHATTHVARISINSVHQLKLAQEAILIGRTPFGFHNEEEEVDSCVLYFYPASDSAVKQSLKFTFEVFFINDTGVEVLIEQSPFLAFETDTHSLVSLNRKSRVSSFYTSEMEYFVKVSLKRLTKNADNYNFRIRVQRTGSVSYLTTRTIQSVHKTTDANQIQEENAEDGGLSFGVKIIIGVIAFSVAGVILFLIYKTIKLRLQMKDLSDDGNFALDNQTRPRTRTNSYTSLPVHGETGSGNTNGHHHSNRNDDDSHVLMDFPYANMPMVVVNTDGTPAAHTHTTAPPTYTEALGMQRPSAETPTYSNIG